MVTGSGKSINLFNFLFSRCAPLLSWFLDFAISRYPGFWFHVFAFQISHFPVFAFSMSWFLDFSMNRFRFFAFCDFSISFSRVRMFDFAFSISGFTDFSIIYFAFSLSRFPDFAFAKWTEKRENENRWNGRIRPQWLCLTSSFSLSTIVLIWTKQIMFEKMQFKKNNSV